MKIGEGVGTPFEDSRRRLLAEFAAFPVSPKFSNAFAVLGFSSQQFALAKSILQIEGVARPWEVRAMEYVFGSISCALALSFGSKLKNYTVGPFQIGIMKSLQWTRTRVTPNTYFKRMLFLGSVLGSARMFKVALRYSRARKNGAVDLKLFSDFYNGIGNHRPHTLKYSEVLQYVVDSHRVPRKLANNFEGRVIERIGSRLDRIRQLVDGGEALDAVVMLSSVSERGIIFSRYFGSSDGSYPVLDIPRPVGSTLKVGLYAAAFEMCAINAGTLIEDAPFEISWLGEKISPRNADRQFRGQVSLEYAFANSINIPAIKLMQMLGVEKFVDYLRKCGVHQPLPNSPLIALGGVPLTGQELLSTITPILTGGSVSWPNFSAHRYDSYLGDGERILSPETCRMMKELFRASFICGTAKFLETLTNPGLGGKTGTSEGTRDLWFLGAVTEDVSGLVWLGFKDGRPITSLDGKEASSSRFAVPLWSEVVATLLDGTLPNLLDSATDSGGN